MVSEPKRGRALALVASALIALSAPVFAQDEALIRGRDALSKSEFVEALEACEQVSDPAEALRLRMDILYSAGDLAGALGSASRLMVAAPMDPHGAYMTSRLAYDLGQLERGALSLESFWQRLEVARVEMPRVTFEWYESKGLGLEELATSLAEQKARERRALMRSRIAVGLGCLLLLALVLRVGKPRRA